MSEPFKSSDSVSVKASTVHGEVLAFAKRVLGGQALATLLLMGLAIGGYRALAQESKDGGAAVVAPVAAELERVKLDVAEQKKDLAEVKRQVERNTLLTIETNANVRLLLENRGIKPVELAPKDGGQ